MKKLFLLAIAGVGYVLGARAGRERYDQIASFATKVKNDPRVQDAASQAADTAKANAPVVKDKVTAAAGAAGSAAASTASAAKDKVTGSSNDSDLESQLNPDSTALQDNPYPQGDLP